MQKWIGAGVLVAAAGAGLAWQQGWFGTAAGSEPLTAYVPADTVLYVGGQADADQMEHIRKLPLMANSQFQAKQLLDELERSNRRQTPQGLFATALFADFIRNANTYGDMAEHYGLDLTKPQAIYMDGLVPVIRFGLNNEAAFWQVLDKASADSGLQPREVTIGDTTAKLWRLTAEGDKTLDLAVNVRGGTATITAFHFLDQDSDQQQRLALTKPARSLADSGELDQLRKTYSFDDSMLALLHFQRLAQGILQPESNGFGQDLGALLKSQNKPLPGEEMEAACRTEVLDLISQVPRLVAGNTNTSSGKVLQMQTRSVLELTNAEVVGTLSSLRGHIPGHTRHSEGQILGFGAGLNIDNLVPAATTLFNKFTSTESNCPQVRRMQREMSGASPAMMGMFTGMVQGTKGIGFSLYDLELDGNNPIPSSYDFLFSIATSNPQPLLGMLSMSPMGRQLQIPTDGSLADVDLSFIAPGLSLKAGVQGNHLVAFAGDKAQQAVDKLKAESLEPNGLTHLSADYSRFADLIDAIPPMIASEMNAGLSESGCVAQAQLSHMLRSQSASLDYTLDIIDQGVSTDISMKMDTTALAGINPVGQYTLMDQTWDCAGGEALGIEEIRADKTGVYTYAADGCDLYRTEYTWSQQGNLFSVEPTKAESRDSCEAEWKPEELVSSQCILLPADQGFRCIYSDDDRESLFHYIPRS
ncbi:hypothetical protein [Marinobacterium sediminicola]|uniref:Uncharacterized protein n=1 Tax=Marinobacterium sediminicola TaxID=518898 RepID=A0ABY1S0L0_9GAMM|nr:hypothetical protein [Marinobacterium sediminicola]ULG69612.1 hypothetical protein LN244_02000 [Marinobacterium sediminicola]SMR74660.1 hypothetical protein SAMN04487964_107124 [Marinobacterium sediminicola]